MWHVAVGLAHVEAPWLRYRLVGTVCTLRQNVLKRMITFHLISLHSDTDFKGSWSFFTGTAVCVFLCACELLTRSQKAVPGSRTVFNEGKGMASKSCNPIYMCRSAHTHSEHTLLSASKKKSERSLSALSRNLAAHFLTLTERWLRYRWISENVKLVWKALNVKEKEQKDTALK